MSWLENLSPVKMYTTNNKSQQNEWADYKALTLVSKTRQINMVIANF